MADSELEILIEDDVPAAGAEGGTVEKPEKKEIDPTEAIAKLKGDLEASKRETSAATTRATQAEHVARQAAADASARTKEVADTNLALVSNAIDSIETAQASAKAALRAASAEGNHEAVADLMEQMSENSAKLLQLRSGKAAMEEDAKTVKREPTRETPLADPVENIASQLNPKSAAWIRSHPEYAKSPDMYQKVVRADAKAWGEGIERDTPEYFAHVEKTLGISSGDNPSRERNDPPPAAAPGGGSRELGQERPSSQVVRLSKDEVEMAENLGMTPQEYAKNKISLQKEGRIAS